MKKRKLKPPLLRSNVKNPTKVGSANAPKGVKFLGLTIDDWQKATTTVKNLVEIIVKCLGLFDQP